MVKSNPLVERPPPPRGRRMGLPALVLAGVIASVALPPHGVTVLSNAGSLNSAHLRTANAVWKPAAEESCAGSGRSWRDTGRSDPVVYSMCSFRRILANRVTGSASSDRSVRLELRGGSETVGDLLLEDENGGEGSSEKQGDEAGCRDSDSYTGGDVCAGLDARRTLGASEAGREQGEETRENAGEEEDHAKGEEEEGEEEEDVCMCCSEPLVEAARGACGHRYYKLRPGLLGLTDYSQVDMLGLRYASVNFGAEHSPGSPYWWPPNS